jgi:ribosomal RNA methyltransferase Nop2
MGRRAKNKQGAPEPLEHKVATAPKTLGKRKADADSEVDGKARFRSAKKIKEYSEKGRPRVHGKVKGNGTVKSASRKVNVKKDVEEGSEPDSSAESWENTENTVGLESQAR